MRYLRTSRKIITSPTMSSIGKVISRPTRTRMGLTLWHGVSSLVKKSFSRQSLKLYPSWPGRQLFFLKCVPSLLIWCTGGLDSPWRNNRTVRLEHEWYSIRVGAMSVPSDAADAQRCTATLVPLCIHDGRKTNLHWCPCKPAHDVINHRWNWHPAQYTRMVWIAWRDHPSISNKVMRRWTYHPQEKKTSVKCV